MVILCESDEGRDKCRRDMNVFYSHISILSPCKAVLDKYRGSSPLSKFVAFFGMFQIALTTFVRYSICDKHCNACLAARYPQNSVHCMSLRAGCKS